MESPQPSSASMWTASKKITVDSSDSSILQALLLTQPGGVPQIATTTSSKSIKVYNCETSTLVRYYQEAHTERIGEIAKCPSQPSVFCSVGEDGLLCFWDSRTKNAIKVITSGKKLLSVDVSSDFKSVVAGGENSSFVWDINGGQMVATYEEMHTDDVVQVRFHNQKNYIYTGAFDGLIAIFDPTLGNTEEEAYISAVNVEQAINKMSFFGRNEEFLWATTGTECLSIWDLTNESLLSYTADTRSKLAALIPSSPSTTSSVNYLIACDYDSTQNLLHVYAGSHDGIITIFSTSDGKVLNYHSQLTQFHTDTVRTMSASHHLGLLVTGGDDGVLGIWRRTDASLLPTNTNKARHLKSFDPLSSN